MILTGKKILLRHAEPKDYPSFFEILNDQVTMQHLIPFFGRDTWTIEQVAQRYKDFELRRQKGEGLPFAVILQDGTVAGSCGFRIINKTGQEAEFGLILSKTVWGTVPLFC